MKRSTGVEIAGDDPTPTAASAVRHLTVSQFAERLQRALVTAFPQVTVSGEIGECTRAASGHLYFTLKDEQSHVSAVMWRANAAQLTFPVQPGLQVLCIGQPSVYPKTGRLQLVVREMQPAGAGALQRRFLELKRKLEGEGLFGQSRKRPMPKFPRAIGVVSSANGAAIHDIMARVRERMPSLQVFLYDVRVQGEGSAQEIAAAIAEMNRRGGVDLQIVGRGGGSLEDLWAFNEEVVVRAIFASRLPVVSAVGHEVDVTLADLVADLRAPTPTAAAELVVPSRAESRRQLEEFRNTLTTQARHQHAWKVQALDESAAELASAMQRRMQVAQHRHQMLSAAVSKLHPVHRLAAARGAVQQLSDRLLGLVARKLATSDAMLLRYVAKLERHPVLRDVVRLRERMADLTRRLPQAVERQLSGSREGLNRREALLAAINPARVLQRGFALVRHQGNLVREGSSVPAAGELEVQFAADSIAVKRVR